MNASNNFNATPEVPWLARRARIAGRALSLLLLALAIAGTGRGGAAGQDVKFAPVQVRVWPDEQFEQRWYFNRTAMPPERVTRLDSHLALQVNDIDRACRLTDRSRKELNCWAEATSGVFRQV